MRHYEQKNIGFARQMRHEPTPAEQNLWRRLRDHRMTLKWRRQHPFGPYILDFFCPSHKIAIELDGDSHLGKEDYDARRVEYLEARDVYVLRLPNEDFSRDDLPLIEAIQQAVEYQVGRGIAAPSPGSLSAHRPPPQRGEVV